MKLVVAGLGRTGTQSLTQALKVLGLQTLSQEDLIADTPRLLALLAAARGDGPFSPDLIPPGTEAAIGWPLCWLYPELLTEWPEAVCLLNVRDADAWFDSVSRAWTVLGPLRKLRFNQKLRAVDTMLGTLEQKMGGPLDRARWTASYRAHIEAVRQSVPADRLLVYEIGSGWQPLCDLLNLSTPDTPFPRGNSSKNGEFQQKVKRLLGWG